MKLFKGQKHRHDASASSSSSRGWLHSLIESLHLLTHGKTPPKPPISYEILARFTELVKIIIHFSSTSHHCFSGPDDGAALVVVDLAVCLARSTVAARSEQISASRKRFTCVNGRSIQKANLSPESYRHLVSLQAPCYMLSTELRHFGMHT
jgi:hypothetical protein